MMMMNDVALLHDEEWPLHTHPTALTGTDRVILRSVIITKLILVLFYLTSIHPSMMMMHFVNCKTALLHRVIIAV